MSFLGGIIDGFRDITGNMMMEEDRNQQQAWNSDQAQYNRDFQERMRNTQYQTAVQDMQKAGLNPMLAYHQGGAGTPTGATAAAASGKHPPTGHSIAAGFNSAAQAELATANAETARATADRERASAEEIRARTPTHAVSIEHMKQQIGESAVRVEKIWQDTKTGASSAALMDQQVRNLREEIPRIRATVAQLKASTDKDQAISDETRQRIKQNLPELEAIAAKLENKLREIQQPQSYQQADVKASFVGLLGDYLRALNPLQGFIGVVPTRPATQIHNHRGGK